MHGNTKKLTKFLGTDTSSVQIDEYYFSSRRKYNRGRMLNGDKKNGCGGETYDVP